MILNQYNIDIYYKGSRAGVWYLGKDVGRERKRGCEGARKGDVRREEKRRKDKRGEEKTREEKRK